MASESKKRKAFKHSMCMNGAMKWDVKMKRCAMFHKADKTVGNAETADAHKKYQS